VTIVYVSHLNQGVGGDALLRVSGSLAFVAAARSASIVLKDKDQPTRRLFLPIKNNLGSDCSGLAFELSGVTLDSAAGPIDTCHAVWESEPVEMTANEAMPRPAHPRPTTWRDLHPCGGSLPCFVPTVGFCRPRRTSGDTRCSDAPSPRPPQRTRDPGIRGRVTAPGRAAVCHRRLMRGFATFRDYYRGVMATMH
jgi:hypothetical protein